MLGVLVASHSLYRQMDQYSDYLLVVDGPFEGDSWARDNSLGRFGDQESPSLFRFRMLNAVQVDMAGPRLSMTLEELEVYLASNKGETRFAAYVIDNRDNFEGFYYVCNVSQSEHSELMELDECLRMPKLEEFKSR